MATAGGTPPPPPPAGPPAPVAPDDEPPRELIELLAALQVALHARVAGTIPKLARPGQANKDDQLLNNYINNALTYRPRNGKEISAGLAHFRRNAAALRLRMGKLRMGHVIMLSILVELLREVCQQAAAAAAASDDDSDSN